VRQKATSSEAIKHSDNDSTQGAQIFNVTIERGTNINFGGKHTTIYKRTTTNAQTVQSISDETH